MSEANPIVFFSNKKIDKDLWDERLGASFNPLIYAESVFLDHLSPGWSALIHENGSSMMPFPLRKKLGISYAFQPPFTQQLGIFHQNAEPVDADAFIKKAMEYAALIDMNFNYRNSISESIKRCNYILNLEKSFDELKKKFRKDLVSKALSNELIYQPGTIDKTINSYIREILPKTKGLANSAISRFKSLCYHYASENRVICRDIISQQNETLGSALFLRDTHRIYYMISATTTRGKSVDANAFLLHEIIREFSGNPLVFDFEGSELPGVKFFFEKFSPENQPYFRVQRNRLNGVQKVIKSIRDLIRK